MWEFWTSVPTFIAVLHFVAIIIVIFIERKSPVQTIVWILALMFLPFAGILLYIFIGVGGGFPLDRRFRKKREIDRRYDQIIRTQLDLLTQQHVVFRDPHMQNNADMVVMNLNKAGSMYTEDNGAEIFTSAQDNYRRMFDELRRAQHTINIMYFIFRDDEVGNELVNILTERALAGVEVRLIYDSFGNFPDRGRTRRLFRRLEIAGGHVARFLGNPIVNLLRVNYRNHRKIVVIDGKVGYTGGINIGREYMGLHKRKTPWRDTHIRLCGSSVVSLQLRFLMDWWYLVDEDIDERTAVGMYFPDISRGGNVGVQIVSSGPDSSEEQVKYAYLKMINAAKKRLYIQTPYLVPDQSVSDALKIAAASGVDVRIMIPAVPDKRLVYRATLSYAEELIQHGIKIYKYPGFLHAKMLVCDHTMCTIGTTNLDHRSFALNFEINAFMYDAGVTGQCGDIFERDLAQCAYIDPQQFAKRNVFEKILESIMRILSPLF